MQCKGTLSLCMIVKNAEKELPTLWASVKKIVDEWIVVDTGSTDNTVAVARRIGEKKVRVLEKGDAFCDVLNAEHVKFFKDYGIDVEVGEKLFNFGKARTFSFVQATQEFILWLDADDILSGSLKLKQIIYDNLDPDKQLGLHLLYKYEVDQYGNSIMEHYRERVLPESAKYNWQGRIHEVVVPEMDTEYIRVGPDDVHVIHNVEDHHRKTAAIRNIKNLLLDRYEQKEPDPRTLFQLGEALRLINPDMAIKLYKEYLPLSGWDEEQSIACGRLVDIYLGKKDLHVALDWAYRAIKYKPDFPSSYVDVARCYYMLEKYQECELFCKHALEMEQPETVVLVNPKYIKYVPLMLLTLCYFDKGMVSECEKYVYKALNHDPLNQELKQIADTCKAAKAEEKATGAFKEIFDYLAAQGEKYKALKVLDYVPATRKDDPRFVDLRKQGEELMKNAYRECLPTKQELVTIIKALKSRKAQTLHVFGIASEQKKLFSDLGFKIVEDKEKADAVILVGVVDTILNPSDMLQEVSQCLKPGGMILILTSGNVDYTLYKMNTVQLGQMLESLGWTIWNMFPMAEDVVFAEVYPGEKKTKKADVAFICGQGWEQWGPHSIKQGIGGSEEATIHVARELSYLGHGVTVYNETCTPLVMHGVTYKHYSSIGQREHELAVLWRVPHHLTDYNIRAKKIILWLHDVPQKHWFTKERMGRVDKIFCLSEYHKTLMPEELRHRVIVTQNGVDLDVFNKLKVKRDNNKVIYTSSYDRGLEHLLAIWPDVQKECPDAKLHIYYGWGTFDKLRTGDKQLEWKSRMMKQMEDLLGVFEHGRIGQDELAKEFLASGIFAYPCHFEEISCISAMKAQVAGCIPLTTGYAALAETNFCSLSKINGNPRDNGKVLEEFKAMLVGYLKNPLSEDERGLIKQEARSRFDWRVVAGTWSKIIGEELCQI